MRRFLREKRSSVNLRVFYGASAHLEYAPRNSIKLAIGSAPFLRRFLRATGSGISCSGALRVVCAFFPRKLHLRSHAGSTGEE